MWGLRVWNHFLRWGKHAYTSDFGCLASACSLHFTSVVVHINVCMHTLHCIVMAFLFVSSWLPLEDFCFSRFLSRAILAFWPLPPPISQGRVPNSESTRSPQSRTLCIYIGVSSPSDKMGASDDSTNKSGKTLYGQSDYSINGKG